MMKKILVILFLILKNSHIQAIETPAKQGILYDYETKSILFEKTLMNLCHPVP